jgi:hypothetical protein
MTTLVKQPLLSELDAFDRRVRRLAGAPVATKGSKGMPPKKCGGRGELPAPR